MPGEPKKDQGEFTWRYGRDVISLRRQEDGWRVSYSKVGRLLGPRLNVHDATHRVAKHAAWDVMKWAIDASEDEEVGVETALQAAQWMRQIESTGGGSTRA